MNRIAERIQSQGMLPVVRAACAEQAVETAKTLAQENFHVIEIPSTCPDVQDILKALSFCCPQTEYGCSMISDTKQLHMALESGARFVFINATDKEVIDEAVKTEAAVFPVAGTMSEIDAAVRRGFDRISISPINFIGGPDFVLKLKRKYPGIRFMPRGGIASETVEDYLSFGNVFACAGSWLAPRDLMEKGAWEALRIRAQEAVYAMMGFQIESVDIESTETAVQEIYRFQEIFHLSAETGVLKSVGGFLNFTKESFPKETKVRLTLSTNHIKRSVAYLESKGYLFIKETAPVDENGRYPYIYFSDPIGGISVRLLQKDSRKEQ